MDPWITIRKAETIADYQACQQAQRLAWGITDDTYVVPLATLVGAQLHGGLVLGAFHDDGSAVGLSFAFLGKVEARPCLYSQLTGVVPGQQGQGLGYALKQAQREFARGEGLPTLAWAFDPLQAGNARFNLRHLGASAGRYVEDMYGRRSDALNSNAPTDRLIAEWPTTPEEKSSPDPVDFWDRPRLIPTRNRPDGLREPAGGEPCPPVGPFVLLEIPRDIAALRANHPALADAWSAATRRAFREAFALGYRATGFVDEEIEGGKRSSYILTPDQARII